MGAEAFEKSPRWYFKTGKGEALDYDQRERFLLGDQLMRLLDTVPQAEPDSYVQFIGFQSDEKNRNILLRASKLPIRWDAKEAKYRLLDRTVPVPPDVNR